MKKLWIILAIAVILFIWRFRERFEATTNIKNPSTWDAAEINRIKSMVTPKSTEPDDVIRSVVGGFWSVWEKENLRITSDKINAYLAGNTVIIGAPNKKNEYFEMLKQYYLVQGQPVFLEARGYDPNSLEPPKEPEPTPTGTVKRPSTGDTTTIAAVSTYMNIPRNQVDKINMYIARLINFYDTVYLPDKNQPTQSQIQNFVDQALPNANGLPDPNKPGFINLIDYWFTSAELQGTSSSTLDASSVPGEMAPQCPTGYTLNGDKTECEKADADPCESGYTVKDATTCTKTEGTVVTNKALICPTGSTYNSTVKKCVYPKSTPTCPTDYTFQRTYPQGGVITGIGVCKANNSSTLNNTGGSSGGLFGATSGGPMQGEQTLFGPIFTGTGSLTNPQNATDTSKTNNYPKLIGGIVNPTNTGRLDGVGMIKPTLPYKESVVPGDLDFIPDPFRVSLTYTPSSYSSGKDPIPFLTDFSAFQR